MKYKSPDSHLVRQLLTVAKPSRISKVYLLSFSTVIKLSFQSSFNEISCQPNVSLFQCACCRLELYIKCLSLLFLDSGWLSELADTVSDSTDVQMSNVQMVSTQAHKVRQDGDERM